jgi:NAD(P)-dependent dehydrogenase (short-subunit alcohol dehydrogenase family)
MGLGSATADYFLSKGFLVVAADIKFENVVDERPGRKLIKLPLDISNTTSVENASGVLNDLGISIDILINNAAVFDFFPLSETDPKELDNFFQINTLGAVRLVHAFLPHLIRNKGRVIQISSESSKFPGLFQPYQVSKIAMEAYSRSVRQELALKGVKLVIIRPGAMQTKLFKDLASYVNPVKHSVFEKEFKAFAGKTVQFRGRTHNPETVARVIHRAATARYPRYYYNINHNPVLTLFSWLPVKLIDKIVIWMVR